MPLKFTLDIDTSTIPCKSLFCGRQNIFTIVAADFASEETAYTVVLTDESNLLAQKLVQCLEELYIRE